MSFNPRAREGRDRWFRERTTTTGVSIHAPARGATRAAAFGTGAGRGFNPRAREGRDRSAAAMPSNPAPFQSTRPRGARPRHQRPARRRAAVSIHAPARGATPPRPTTPCGSWRFNPRAREGRDRGVVAFGSPTNVFQSTRPRGARRMATEKMCCLSMFQSTRPRGARRCSVSLRRSGSASFNPRAREGRDAGPAKRPTSHKEFQSTRPRGARRSARASSN